MLFFNKTLLPKDQVHQGHVLSWSDSTFEPYSEYLVSH